MKLPRTNSSDRAHVCPKVRLILMSMPFHQNALNDLKQWFLNHFKNVVQWGSTLPLLLLYVILPCETQWCQKEILMWVEGIVPPPNAWILLSLQSFVSSFTCMLTHTHVRSHTHTHTRHYFTFLQGFSYLFLQSHCKISLCWGLWTKASLTQIWMKINNYELEKEGVF